MAKCSFCSYDIELGTGKMYVKKEGKIHYFCSTKCEKNLLKLERKPREHKWTGVFEKGTPNKKAEGA